MTTPLPAKLLTNDELIGRMFSNILYLKKHNSTEDAQYLGCFYTFYRDEAIVRGIDVSDLPRKLKHNTRLPTLPMGPEWSQRSYAP